MRVQNIILRNLFWRQEVSGCSLLVVWVEIGCVGLGWVGLAKGSAGTKYCTQLANRYVLERLVFSTPTCHLSTITGGIPHSNPDGLTHLIWGFAWQIVCCVVVFVGELHASSGANPFLVGFRMLIWG